MSNLNRYQFSTYLTPEDLGSVRATDFKGFVGDPDPVGRMNDWQEKFGGSSAARPYAEGESPDSKVNELRQAIRSGEGIRQPIMVNEWADGSRGMADGHHRAVAAFLENEPVRATINVHKDV